MKDASNALQALLNSRNFLAIDLYMLTLANGDVFCFSAGDADVLVGNHLYSCGGLIGPFWGVDGNRSTIHEQLGTQVSTLTVGVLPNKATFKGFPYGEARRFGLFDGAWIDFSTAYFPFPPQATQWPLVPVGTLPMFSGPVGAIDGGGTDMVFTVNNLAKLLQLPFPHEVVTPGCMNVLGDLKCGVSLAAYNMAGTALAGSDAFTIYTALAKPTDYFTHGVLTFTSGQNQGFSMTIESWTEGNPGVFTMIGPFPQAPALGDTFSVIPGCDGSFGPQGCPKFANQSNFRGMPYVPPPSTAN